MFGVAFICDAIACHEYIFLGKEIKSIQKLSSQFIYNSLKSKKLTYIEGVTNGNWMKISRSMETQTIR